MFSARSAFDLSLNALARAHAKVRDGNLLDLTESNPTHAGIAYDGGAILPPLAAPASLLYEPFPFGLPSARTAVAADLSLYGPPVDPSRVVLTASTSEAYTFLFKLLCDPEDEVLVPRPSYPLFEHLARLECVQAVSYRLAYDGAWHVDLPSVRAAVSKRTRAIVAVSPNNPTGSYLKREELTALADLGLPIVSDEVFGRYATRTDPTRACSALEAGDRAPLVFSLGGLSKLAGLPQMKVAWMGVGGEAARVAEALGRLEVIADAFLSVGTPVQCALPALLSSRGVAEGAIRARVLSNLAGLRSAVEGSAVSLLDVEGGWSAILRLPQTRTEEAWALAFLEGDSVHVHPGHFYDFEDEAYMIVSLLTPEATLREGVRRMVARVDRDA
jgi:aspartate/methionine/tyrosine aminotransferase